MSRENDASYQEWGKSCHELEKQSTDVSTKMNQILEKFDKDC